MGRDMSNAVMHATRPSLALIVLVALFALGSRTPEEWPADEIDRSRPQIATEPQLRRNWAVDVDGWRIEVDGVRVDRTAGELWGADDVPDLSLGKLALYADSIGRHAADEGIDWRLVAAVIAEESAFNPNALSPAGAFGLMQVKEEAARDVDVIPYSDADANIKAGVRYLAAMRDRFRGATPRDHQAMMLAAYNMGPGHLRDALRLADELGYAAHTWDESLDAVVLLLEQPAIHQKLRHGYAQGRQVVRYVGNVLQRYGAYRRQFPGVTMPSVLMVADIASR